MAKKNIQLIAKVLCSLLCKMCSAEDSPITSHKKFIYHLKLFSLITHNIK